MDWLQWDCGVRGVGNGTAGTDGWVGLSEAIAALRGDLSTAWWDGQNGRVRFQVEPVELTLQVGVTGGIEGNAGIKWHILAIGGRKSHETTTTQTLKLTLKPVIYGDDGAPLPAGDQLISGLDDTDDSDGGAGE